MLSIKNIRENFEEVEAGLAKKHVKADLDHLIKLDDKRRQLIVETDELKNLKNKASKEIPQLSGQDKEKKIAQMKESQAKSKTLERELEEIKTEIDATLVKLPNPAHESVPEGADEQDNVVIDTWGKKPSFDFKPKDHVDIGKDLDIIDIERAAKVSGSRFSYIKGQLVLLELALVWFALDKLIKKGFTPMLPPVLVKEAAMYGTGFLPADEAQIYKTALDDLYLIGTSEVPLASYHSDEIIEEEKLPLRYTGFSTCFRREAGAYGKDTRGMFRVHQFDKVEMFSFCSPDKSYEEHDFIRQTEEEMMQELGLPYRVVNICGGDLGAPAAKKYDLEIYLPGQDKYRELTSCSNCTDFQARRLNIRMRTDKGNQLLHTLNGTAIAVGRTIIAILENYQQKDGSVKVPEVLQKYTGFEVIKK
ncbi:MAG: serine--tRNA ligase [Actinobacteria bacterium]|nr:MAG: serine--tRNA ligase [Actinomycetota bacterium]